MDNINQNQAANGGMPPQNNMSLAIVATVLSVLCCGIQSIVTLPLGIIAIVKANSVTNLFFSGQEFQANEAAKNAKTFSIISLCITGVSLIISIIIGFIVGFSNIMEIMNQN